MNFEDKRYQQIEDFLKGNLTGPEEEAFAKEMAASPDLASRVDKHKLAEELVLEHKLLDVKSILQEEIQKGERIKLIQKLVAAGVGIILAALLLSFLIANKDKAETINQKSVPAPDTASVENLSRKQTPVLQEEKNLSVVPIEKPLLPESRKDTKVETANFITEPEQVIEIKDSVSDNVEASNKPLQTKKDTAITQKTDQQKVADPCADFEITARLTPVATCEGEAEGRIEISKITGGTAPYSTTITDEEGNIVTGNNLPAGLYSVRITEGTGCSKKYKEVSISEKACMKEYSFNPFYGESFDIPYYKEDGIFTVYDKSGKTWFSKTVQGTSAEKWDGSSANGDINTGYYMFTIRYSDGKQKQGYITIVR